MSKYLRKVPFDQNPCCDDCANDCKCGTNKECEKNCFELKLALCNYRPKDIQVEIIDCCVQIRGKRLAKCDRGWDEFKFLRKYEIPPDVNINTLVYHISNKGILLLRAERKPVCQKEAVRNLSDKNWFRVVINTYEFKKDEIEITVFKRCVVVEGKKRSKTDCGDCCFETCRQHFRRTFNLDKNVDIKSLRSHWCDDGTMILEAQRRCK